MHLITNELEFIKSLKSEKHVSGYTHNFYRYPARFSPEFAREAILQFSKQDDYVLDAFMGSGTTIVEAIANGRNAIGVDINPLSYFIATVKTTPLSKMDKKNILEWVNRVDFDGNINATAGRDNEGLKHIPEEYKNILVTLINDISTINYPRQRNFIKCVLLRFAQWAIDCREEFPHIDTLKGQLIKQTSDMLDGLDSWVSRTKEQNTAKNKITGKRQLLLGSFDEMVNYHVLDRMKSKVRLVLTSPPYPGVHVLYHRWQVNSRRETPAPFWIAGLEDGHGESYYTLGGRSKIGAKNYFTKLAEIFRSIKLFIHPDAIIVQLVAFSEPEIQLPAFLDSMELAGYKEFQPLKTITTDYLYRSVPSRKWYSIIDNNQNASNEIVLFHKPIE